MKPEDATEYLKITVEKVRDEIIQDVGFIHKMNQVLFTGPPAIAGLILIVRSFQKVSEYSNTFIVALAASIPLLIIALALSLRSQSGYIRRRGAWLKYYEDKLGLGRNSEIIGWETYCAASREQLDASHDARTIQFKDAQNFLAELQAKESELKLSEGLKNDLIKCTIMPTSRDSLTKCLEKVLNFIPSNGGGGWPQVRKRAEELKDQLAASSQHRNTEYYAGFRDFLIDLYYWLLVIYVVLTVHQLYQSFGWSIFATAVFVGLYGIYRAFSKKIATAVNLTEDKTIEG